MMMKNKMIRALGLSSVAAVGLNMGIANAATLEGNAQVIVLSTINLVETAPLDFGTIAAFADNQATPLGQAVLTLPASGAATTLTWTGTATVANANIVEIVAGSPGIFTVAGAAPNQALTVTTADTDVMTDPSTTSATRLPCPHREHT
ncbi:MAG: hypothetical protein OEX07_12085 [Gammaproteobacteria bacterium]|nr:hypothetical protein [Gammaproteobacteria bacterium]